MTEEEKPPDAAPPMPRWVPVLIGVVLVLIAGLAVWTGIRYRQPTLANGIVKSRRPPRPMSGAGAPGEPEPGASLILPGETPTASAPIGGRTRVEIAGGGTQGVSAVMRLWARRGMTVTVTPDDAIVYVNDTPIGQASQWTGVYEFAQPGSYTIRIAAPGYREKMFVVTAAENAQQEVAGIKATLEKQ
jgi:PEGA domain